MPTRQECIDNAARVFVQACHDAAQRTPREQAEAAWSPGSPESVDQLEDRFRAERGMAPLDRTPVERSA